MIALLIDRSHEKIVYNCERYNVDGKCEWAAFFSYCNLGENQTQSVCFLTKHTQPVSRKKIHLVNPILGFPILGKPNYEFPFIYNRGNPTSRLGLTPNDMI